MQNKEFVGSDTSCNCLFAEQTICYSVIEKKTEKWEWYFWLNLPGAGYEERKLPPFLSSSSSIHTTTCIQVTASVYVKYASFQLLYLLCHIVQFSLGRSQSPPSMRFPILGMRTLKNLPLAKQLQRKVNFAHHRFLNLPEWRGRIPV